MHLEKSIQIPWQRLSVPLAPKPVGILNSYFTKKDDMKEIDCW